MRPLLTVRPQRPRRVLVVDDVRVERRLARRELGCLLLVVVFVLLRTRYVV